MSGAGALTNSGGLVPAPATAGIQGARGVVAVGLDAPRGGSSGVLSRPTGATVGSRLPGGAGGAAVGQGGAGAGAH
jgi:hypothetical protein